MRTTSTLFLATALAGALMGCGDDDGGTPDSGPMGDAGPMMFECPDDAPAPDNQMGGCCWRRSNADRLASPELRIAAIEISSPPTLANLIVQMLLSDAFNQERFNWLFRIEGADADGPVMTTTGYGERNADGTFAFTMGAAPMPGDANRWNPVVLDGTLTGEEITMDAPFMGTFTVPVFDEMDMLLLELPLQNLRVTSMTLTEDRSCVGMRRPTSYTTDDGSLVTFINATDADAGRLVVGTTLDTTLCMFIAGLSTMTGVTCMEHGDPSMWMIKPDSLCEAGTCTPDPGDGSVCAEPAMFPPEAGACNAWQLIGEFAAQGVEIN